MNIIHKKIVCVPSCRVSRMSPVPAWDDDPRVAEGSNSIPSKYDLRVRKQAYRGSQRQSEKIQNRISFYHQSPNELCPNMIQTWFGQCSPVLHVRRMCGNSNSVQPLRHRQGTLEDSNGNVCALINIKETILKRRAPCLIVSATNDDRKTGSDSDGDDKVQESLIDMINLEIGKKKYLDDHVEESSEKLKHLAEEAKQEMDKATELTKMRSDLAFDQALADINREADKFERKLKRSREEQQAGDREFNSWEKDVQESRNEGTFFKSLYKSEGVNDDRDVVVSKSELQQRAKRVVEPAEHQARSPARLYIFGLMCSTLIINIIADVSTSAPSIGLDVLYAVLAGLALWLAVHEKSLVDAGREDS